MKLEYYLDPKEKSDNNKDTPEDGSFDGSFDRDDLARRWKDENPQTPVMPENTWPLV